MLLSRVGAPRLGSDWLLIDVISADKRGTGALLVLQVYLLACRARQYSGVCAIAVSRSGRHLFQQLGFETHSYRDGGSKALCWARAGSLSMQQISRRLSFDGSEALLGSVCWRMGLTAATSSRLVSRC